MRIRALMLALVAAWSAPLAAQETDPGFERRWESLLAGDTNR
ncbi:hypothetical protein [Erythrobacter sp. JK5]|nr:hypothetical protein [Erythrobacter sp. JK5]